MSVRQNDGLGPCPTGEPRFSSLNDFVCPFGQRGIHQHPFSAWSPDEIDIGKTYWQPTDIRRNSRE
jgi:hypothetical protein